MSITTITSIPPQAIEAEQAILGGLMLDNQKLDDIFDILDRRHFYTNSHQCIFDAMVNLTQDGQAVDLVTVRTGLEKAQDLDKIGGLSYLDSIMNNTPGTSNILTYAQIVYDKAIEREMLRVGQGVQEILRAELSTQEKLDKFEYEITQISERKNTTGPVRVDACIGDALDEIELRCSVDGLIGLPTGLLDVDNSTGGLEGGDLLVLAGTPGSGKTSFAMNIAQNTVLREDKTALVFSLEMPKQQLLWRLFSTISGVDFTDIKNGRLTQDQFGQVSAASRKIVQSNLFIDDEGALSVLQIRSRARKVNRDNPLDLIVIDYLQLMSGEGDNTNARLEKITPALKALAKELNIPIIILSQLNRDSVKQSRRPNMSDLRGSGSIEQDADTIFFLYRLGSDEEKMPTVELIIGKNRNGPTETIYTTFNKPILKYLNGARPVDMAQFEPKKSKRGFEYK